MRQQQFLNVVTAEEARRIFSAAILPKPLGEETIPLSGALGRVLSRNIISAINVPFFDRSNVDGYAVQAANTFGADESHPVFLKLSPEVIHTNVAPKVEITSGTTSSIATGGVIPRGADAVVMVEDTTPQKGGIHVFKSVIPGGAISFAGTDIASGETVLHGRTRLTSRETGVLAAIGRAEVPVFRRPRVGIISTGDEIIPPGDPISLGKTYDSNGVIISDALIENGCEPVHFGIVKDDAAQLRSLLEKALECDFVILSGGTSKGAGDLNYTVVDEMGPPGILVHGVALKPGKPLCLAMIGKTPLAILPGFPTSAVFTFHEFIVPILRIMAGEQEDKRPAVQASLPLRVNSEKGRTEYLLVNLVVVEGGYAAYPMGKGSGSVTTFSKADGYITIDRNREILEAGESVGVTLIGNALAPADLIMIGSQCVGVDYLLSLMSEAGWRVKFIPVGSMGGLAAVKRKECDIAGMHLLDEKTGKYNITFLDDTLELAQGYGRKQGLLFRPDDNRFAGIATGGGGTVEEALTPVLADDSALMINRNRGSGTRALIDKLLEGAKPKGFLVEAKSHNAVAAAIKQGRADWGVAIENVARPLELGFVPIVDEEYDFVLSRERMEREPVKAFLALLKSEKTRQGLREIGMSVREDS